MICQRCRTSILSRIHQHTIVPSSSARQPTLRLPWTSTRNYSDGKPSTAPSPPSQPRQPVAGDSTAPAAVSSATPGVSQPLSTPEGVHTDAAPEKATKKSSQRTVSSCAPGTKLLGLNYFKNKPDVFALDDSEYPKWLWGLLEHKADKTATGGVDVSCMLPDSWRCVLYN